MRVLYDSIWSGIRASQAGGVLRTSTPPTWNLLPLILHASEHSPPR